MSNILSKKTFWEENWLNYFNLYQNDIRHGLYLDIILINKSFKILEIAAGSFRDVIYLNNVGYDCIGCDYSEHSIDLAKNTFQNYNNKIYYENAFNFSYKCSE